MVIDAIDGNEACNVCEHIGITRAVARVRLQETIYNACPVALYVANETTREYVKNRFNLGGKNADK